MWHYCASMSFFPVEEVLRSFTEVKVMPLFKNTPLQVKKKIFKWYLVSTKKSIKAKESTDLGQRSVILSDNY